MQKYEYRREPTITMTNVKLTQLGKEGWALTAVEPSGTLFFMRPLQAPEPSYSERERDAGPEPAPLAPLNLGRHNIHHKQD